MASLYCSFWGMFMVSMAYFASLALSSSQLHVEYSTISAAPAFLPSSPLSSPPSLPPDIEPIFPTPKGMAPSPTDESVPTIPSSPSPPNPDNYLLAPGPGFALSPFGSFPVSSSVSLTSTRALNFTLFLGFLVVYLLQQQLSGV